MASSQRCGRDAHESPISCCELLTHLTAAQLRQRHDRSASSIETDPGIFFRKFARSSERVMATPCIRLCAAARHVPKGIPRRNMLGVGIDLLGDSPV